MHGDSLIMYSSQCFPSTNNIGHNELTGAIPSEIGILREMISFDAGETLPTFLTTIDLFHNSHLPHKISLKILF